MSSFLMNPQQQYPPPTADPKFPPIEEYSQGNYIQDYYGSYGGFHGGYGHHQPQLAVENGGSYHGGGLPSYYPQSRGSCSVVGGTVPEMVGTEDSMHHQNNRSSPESSPPPGSMLQRSDNGQNSDCSGSEPPVIYPWMRKVHTNNPGEFVYLSKLNFNYMVTEAPF
ncbi:hypothetical protein JTE90_012156 [Oedothorax gibbosus]|uniref:Uncharacterized protein n=1 Tax=Oedothorax gibbosus TaxID=931172 RepID=A0AAV6UKD5_9ARAC|nr:hypothetical protein JTE90_012156 [Oedothorax gibbosus]